MISKLPPSLLSLPPSPPPTLLGVISDPSQSGALDWLGTILWYMFTGLWVLPVFWISKPINSIWFQVNFDPLLASITSTTPTFLLHVICLPVEADKLHVVDRPSSSWYKSWIIDGPEMHACG